jgi:aspartyl-tRNA(Asn)/glutamyl-tRNA(Gln) amidotransferase subunit B
LEFRTVIGLEVHAQVLTNTKMFSSCPVPLPESPPNTTVCPVSLGLPGMLPVVNRVAVEKTVSTGLALNCEIPRVSKFDRKNYVYPDLPKGYQISQYDLPLAKGGHLEFSLDGAVHRVGITRVHLEEDTARLLHRTGPEGGYSLVDVNRAGVPLMEIVSDPDLESPAQARQFLIELRRILRYIDASTGDMEKGALRCDANVSIRSTDGTFVGPKVEIKNMNSFRAVERALLYEEVRQREAVAAGTPLVQETRGWLDDGGVTVSQRTKEYADDYRYFPEPDLPPLELADTWVDRLRQDMAELPAARRARFVTEYGLSADDAAVLTDEWAVADFYEETVRFANGRARESANWITGEVFALARAAGGLEQLPLTPGQVSEVIDMVEAGVINQRTGKSVLAEAARTETSPRELVDRQGLGQVNDSALIHTVALDVVASNPKAVADYRAGKSSAIGFLIGQAMRNLRGAGNPDIVRNEIIAVLNRQNE